MTLSSQHVPPTGNSPGLQHEGEIFNKCLQAIQSNRATIEDCVKQYPEYSDLGMMLQATLAVEEVPKVALSPIASSDMRQRILAHYDAQPVRKSIQPVRYRSWMRPLVAIITSFIVLFTGSASLIHAASLAVPGDTLYGIKRATENVQ